MYGSNNEVAVLDAVLSSLAKSPAFAQFEAPVSEPVNVFSLGFSDFMTHIEKLEEDENTLPVEGDLFNEKMNFTLTPSEEVEMDEMERLLSR